MIYFVTGTDTGAGKTHVTAAIVHGLRAAGREARAIKPIETGWNQATSDAARLAQASARSIDDSVYMRFALARSPQAAAAAEGRAIDLDDVIEWCRAQSGDPLLIEGAGGWRVPIGGRREYAELARSLDAQVIVVGRAGLGTINHSVLTLDAAQARIAVLSRLPTDDLGFARDNARAIEEMTGARVAIVPDDLPTILGWF